MLNRTSGIRIEEVDEIIEYYKHMDYDERMEFFIFCVKEFGATSIQISSNRMWITYKRRDVIK